MLEAKVGVVKRWDDSIVFYFIATSFFHSNAAIAELLPWCTRKINFYRVTSSSDGFLKRKINFQTLKKCELQILSPHTPVVVCNLRPFDETMEIELRRKLSSQRSDTDHAKHRFIGRHMNFLVRIFI